MFSSTLQLNISAFANLKRISPCAKHYIPQHVLHSLIHKSAKQEGGLPMKKAIAIILTVTILCTLLTVPVSAASYSTGSYTVSSSNGVNVRSGAGSGYSRVGAARNGVTFSVSKISGSWGYTSSIQTTSGTKAGFRCGCAFRNDLHRQRLYPQGLHLRQ